MLAKIHNKTNLVDFKRMTLARFIGMREFYDNVRSTETVRSHMGPIIDANTYFYFLQNFTTAQWVLDTYLISELKSPRMFTAVSFVALHTKRQLSQSKKGLSMFVNFPSV